MKSVLSERMPKERGALFHGDLVKQILAGAKRITRRPVKSQPAIPSYQVPNMGPKGDWRLRSTEIAGACFGIGQCPFGVVGDHLYVRETWGVLHEHASSTTKDEQIADARRGVPWAAFTYRADAYPGMPTSEVPPRWFPSLHMPRFAARIFLRVTDVRVERLQVISEAEAAAEGLLARPGVTSLEQFRTKWDSIYGGKAETGSLKFAWSANPWVWRVAFERIERGA